jgi:acetylornithine deacetylase/succinyl-diaminopimelate desuccinylase-like protein
MRRETERIICASAHPRADVSFQWIGGVDAAGFDPNDPVMLAARGAFEKAFGEEPVLWRMGGTLPLLDTLAKKGIPTVLTGFARVQDKIHAPNESFALDALQQGRVGARALYEAFADL